MEKRTKRLSERDFETRLARLLERRLERSGGQVCTFEDAGLLTGNRGLVVRLAGGQEFQLAIVDGTRY